MPANFHARDFMLRKVSQVLARRGIGRRSN
jgi:hypothetical protein